MANQAKPSTAGTYWHCYQLPATLMFASHPFGSWGRTGGSFSAVPPGRLDSPWQQNKINKPIPAKETPPHLQLDCPSPAPLLSLSQKKALHGKTSGKALDFILPLNGQKTEENRCRRQYFQLATPPRFAHQPLWTLQGACSKRRALPTKILLGFIRFSK